MENNLRDSDFQWFIQLTYPGHYRSRSECPQERSLCTCHVRGCHHTGPQFRLRDLPHASRTMRWRSKDKDTWTFCTCGFVAQTHELPEMGEIESKTHSLLHESTQHLHRNLYSKIDISWIQSSILNRILEERKDTSGKTGKIQMKFETVNSNSPMFSQLHQLCKM